ncbi:MAG: HAD family hydrolase [Hyphomicrobiaceae bacterium]
MQNVDTVVFDIGNVLIRWDPHNLYRRMGLTDVEIAAFMAETALAEVNHRRLDAGAPFTETIAELASRFPHHEELIHAFDRRWPEMLDGAIESSVAILHSLLAAGIPVHAMSNFSRTKFDLARSVFPFLDEFDDLVVSGDVGHVKPDPEIFELLITRCDLMPARTLYIDDSAPNIETARRLGFVTILFDEHQTDLAAELSRLGIRLR